MKIKIIAILLLFCSAVPEMGFCQRFFKQVEVSAGFAWLPQDRRLFEYPGRASIIYYENTKFDQEYFILLNKNVYDTKRLTVSAGVGYSMFISTFSRPFDHNYFTGLGTYELRHISKYIIHNLRVVNALNLNLFTFKKHALRIEAPVILNFACNKNIKGAGINWHRNKWKFEFNNLEIYLGPRYIYSRFNIGIFYRVFNVQAIDPVIFNFLLFRPKDPPDPFLSKKYETLNLNKMMISAGWRF